MLGEGSPSWQQAPRAALALVAVPSARVRYAHFLLPAALGALCAQGPASEPWAWGASFLELSHLGD